MTAYPVTCLIDYEDGYLTVITLEEPSDSDTEAGAIAKLRIKADDGKALQVGLSPEAAEALERRLRELRGVPEDERPEPGTVVGRVSCPCCDVGFEIQAGDDDESEFVAVSQGSSPVIRDLTESVTQAEERVERAEDTLHKLQRWALPIDCPNCEGHGSQSPHSPEDDRCETCGGWTNEKRKRWDAIYIAQGERANDGRSGRCGVRIDSEHWCALDHGHEGECAG